MSKKTIDAAVVEDYLNKAIEYWYRTFKQTDNYEVQSEARTYIDAFQSVRETLLGAKLPIKF